MRNREWGMRNEQRGDTQEDRSHLEPEAWERGGGGGEPLRKDDLDFRIPRSLFRIPYFAPRTRLQTLPHVSTECVGQSACQRDSFHGYTDSGNTRE